MVSTSWTGVLGLAAALAGCVESEVSTGIDRLRLVGEPVALVDQPPLVTYATATYATATATPAFTYVASVDAPVLAGQKVQATNFASDGARAYVVYNTAGSSIAGGLDVLDVSHVDAPALLASRISNQTEYSDVVIKGSNVYTVGSRADGGILTVWDVQTPANPTVVTTLGLGSEYATSIEIEGDYAYITVGTLGGVVVVRVSQPAAPQIVRVTNAANSLYLRRSQGINLVLGGAQGFGLYGEESGTYWPMVAIADAPVPAPGRFATAGHRLFTNGGQTGLTTIDLASNSKTATLASHTALSGTGNGIDSSTSYLFLAQGDAGVMVYSLITTVPSYLGHFDFPDARGSANEVRYALHQTGYGYLFLSDGAAGFRILKFTE